MRVSGVVLVLSFLAIAFAGDVCDEDTGLIIGDPHFTGFYGQTFDFMGTPGNYYNLLSDPYMSLNSRFELTNPSRPSRRTTIMYEIGLIFGEHKVSFESADEVWIDGVKVERQLGAAHAIEISECLTLSWSRKNVMNFHGPHHELEFSLSHNNNVNVNTTFWNVAFLHPIENSAHTGGVLGQTADPHAKISLEESDFICSSIFDTNSQTNKFRGKVAQCNQDVSNKRYAGVERSSQTCDDGEFCIYDGENFDCIDGQQCDSEECGFDAYCGGDGNCYISSYVIDQMADEAAEAYGYYSQVDTSNVGYAVEDEFTLASITNFIQLDVQYMLVNGAQWSDVIKFEINVYSTYDFFADYINDEVRNGDVKHVQVSPSEVSHVPEFTAPEGTVYRVRLPFEESLAAGTYYISVIVRTTVNQGFVLYDQGPNTGNLYYYDPNATPYIAPSTRAAAMRLVVDPIGAN